MTAWRPRIVQAVMLGAVTVEALAGFLPWVRTGRRERTSFELIDAARSLDVLDSGVQRTLAVAWYFVPLLAALCWLTVLLHRPRLAGGLALTAGLLGVALAVAIDQAAIPTLSGVRVTLGAALAAAVGGGLGVMERGR